MEPVLPDAPLEESEFDLDVRLQPVDLAPAGAPTEYPCPPLSKPPGCEGKEDP
jgi:hypothetical protein